MMKKPSLLLVLAALLALCGLPMPSAFAQMDPSIQMVLGNPDGAVNSASSPAKYLIQRPEYALSFNDGLHFPNWVAWHLAAADLGDASRGNFKTDTTLPAGFTRIATSDYTGTGYDRGHNCPSGDRTVADINNDEVFYMTNITPQTHEMNGGPWATLEEYCRSLVSGGSREVMIYCGHGFTSSTRTYIGPQNIPVPDFGWKIAVIVPKSTNANTTDLLSRVTMRTRVIAVRMPNTTAASGSWTRYITSVNAIEAATGLVFFDKVPTKTAAYLKTKVDSGL